MVLLSFFCNNELRLFELHFDAILNKRKTTIFIEPTQKRRERWLKNLRGGTTNSLQQQQQALFA